MFLKINVAIRLLTFTLLSVQLSAVLASNDESSQCQFFFEQAQYKAALLPCEKAAKKNDLAAQTVLGEILDNGSAGIVDRQQAKMWWTKAIEKNYSEAENLLALKYYYGGTIFEKQAFWQQDYTKALNIWTKSAQRGNPASQFMVAEMHRLGQGTTVNLIEAYAWYKLALAGQYSLAEELLYETSKLLNPDDKKLARQIYRDYQSKYILSK